MKVLKKILVLGLVFTTLFSCFSCEEYHYATGRPGGNNGLSDVSSPTLNDDPTDDFTVTVLADGAPYTPRMDINVYWSDKDGSGIFVAPLDENGEARIDGLDGDYRVTLSAVPNEYSYDPNAHDATNENRNITIDLYTLNRLTGSGTSMYDCYHFSKTGVYSAVIQKAGDAIFFEYAPSTSGTYSIESWMDVTADNINPYMDVYYGNSHAKYYYGTTNDGGAMGSYTINFVHTVEIADEMISTSGGGQATYTFAVRAESKNNQYPITVTFAVKRDGDFELGGDNGGSSYMAVPHLDGYNVEAHEYDSSEYALKYPETFRSPNPFLAIFDDDIVALWKKSEGGDGFYHLYDEEKYTDNGGWGPILYANITSACRFVDRSFNTIEYKDGKKGEGASTINGELAMTVDGDKINYKHFIEGYDYLTTYGYINGGAYYCVNDCICHDAEKDITDWACPSSCEKCDVNCRRIPDELIGKKGYAQYANSQGLVAVTEELQQFLAAWCDKKQYFYDGFGWIEGKAFGGKTFQAEGESGWLFACCYYEKK